MIINSQLLSNVVTVTFCGAVVFLVFRYRTHPRMSKELPTLVTTIGVLGTFVGIFLGLLEFNPNNLESSVPALLEGLKTAFITSIFGMAAAFGLKVRSTIHGATAEGNWHQAGATVDTLAEILERTHAMNVAQSKELQLRLKNLEQAIVGDGESTIHTQIIKMRTSMADKQDEMVKEFRNFAAQMAENNSRAFIQALEEVIRDFNTKISEQFGDNFKQLNLAVGQLLAWQENYRDQVAKMVAQLDESSKSLAKAGDSMSLISDKSVALVRSAESLEALLKGLSDLQKETEKNLKAFAETSREAKEMVPRIQKIIFEASQDVGQLIKAATSSNQKLIEAHASTMRETAEQLAVNVQESARSVKSQTDAIAAHRKQIEDMLTKSTGEVGRIWQAASTANQKLLDSHSTAMKERFEAFDDSMGKEIKKVIEVMGGHLAALSGKLVQDYTPLTDNLREVVKLAKDIRR